jgi:hypothetical protein
VNEIVKFLAKQHCNPEYDNFVDELNAFGYVVVPKEPAQEMVIVAHNDGHWGSIHDIYRAMLEAAPST